jgi:DNA polymerase-4
MRLVAAQGRTYQAPMPISLCRDCARLATEPQAACASCGSPRLVEHDELAELCIAHIDCDAFYASVEKRDDPSLIDRPVIVGHPGGRGVVTTACYIARRYGPRSAMPMFKALELCPHAVVIPPNMAKYKSVSAEIRALFLKATPLVEPVSLDEAYLDLSPEARLVDRPAALLLARLARAIEQRVGVTVTVGLSYNKSLSKLASGTNKPCGFTVIGRTEAKQILARLPVTALHGVGAATARRMAEAGIETVAQLQTLPEADLAARYGKFGRRLAHLVQGDDPRRILPDRPAKSISTETTFARDLSDFAALLAELKELALQLEQRLLRSGRAGRTLVLKLKTSDFRSFTRQSQLPHPTRRAEVILAHGERLLRREVDGRSFRLLGIGVGEVTEADEADPKDLFAGLDPS